MLHIKVSEFDDERPRRKSNLEDKPSAIQPTHSEHPWGSTAACLRARLQRGGQEVPILTSAGEGHRTGSVIFKAGV